MKNTILLVDDNKLNRRIMSGLLKSMELDVIEAEDGFEAVELVQTNELSLILMDILMPEMDGYQTTEAIRGIPGFESIPIIAVTADEHDGLTDKMKSVGFNDLITKPLKREHVNALFTTYLSLNDDIFNRDEFESIYDSESMKKSILEAFFEERDNDLSRINSSFESNDFDEIYSAAHYMKGSFSYLKTPKALEISFEIMKMAKEHNKNVFNMQNQFLKEYEMVYTRLSEYYNKL